MQLVLQNHPCRAFLGISDVSRAYQYWLLSLASFKISRDLVHCNCKECPGSFLQETIPAVLSLSILLSFIDKHKLTPVFITDVKLSGFAVFSDTMTLLPNTLLKQFIKQFFQSTLPPLQLKYMLVVIKVLKIQFECWPVLYYSVFFWCFFEENLCWFALENSKRMTPPQLFVNCSEYCKT